MEGLLEKTVLHTRTGPPWEEKLAVWERFKNILAREALDQQQKAVHWKDPPILVGGVGLGWGPNGPKKLYGSNYKPAPGDECPRCCMEEEIEAAAIFKQCDTIVGIATAASYQLDDMFRKDMRGTLPLCPNCRQRIYRMVSCEELYLPKTRIFAQRVDSPFNVTHFTEYTLKEHMREFPPEEKFVAFK